MTAASAPLHVAHVLNYGWPNIDGYTVRSAALVSAQERVLGFSTTVLTSPFAPFASGRDDGFRTPAWRGDRQADAEVPPPRRWERPAVGLAPLTAPAYADWLTGALARAGADVVHAHHPHQNAAPARVAARRLGLPFVFELRCFNGDYDLDAANPYARLRGRRVNALELRCARGADAVVTIAEGLAQRLVDGGVPEGRVHVVRNAVDTARFHPGVPRPARVDGRRHLGYATSFAEMENLDGFLRACRLLIDRRPDLARSFQATLAGDGPEMGRLKALRAELDLASHVALPGFVPYARMPEFLAGLDLFVVTRKHAEVSRQTTPLKPLEALATGVPVLSSDLPAMRELMGGRADVRFAPPTPAGLAEGIERYLDAPWAGTGEIGDRSWSREVLRYPAVYEAVGTGACRAAAS